MQGLVDLEGRLQGMHEALDRRERADIPRRELADPALDPAAEIARGLPDSRKALLYLPERAAQVVEKRERERQLFEATRAAFAFGHALASRFERSRNSVLNPDRDRLDKALLVEKRIPNNLRVVRVLAGAPTPCDRQQLPQAARF